MATILITGTGGFVGFHLSQRLAAEGHHVVGVDDLDPLFYPSLKRERHRRLREVAGVEVLEGDIADPAWTEALVARCRPERVVHLAAHTGVRFSIDHPFAYQRSNVLGTLSVLEAARLHGVRRVVYASSSSVYGNSPRMPWREDDPADGPVSLYAATKRADELMARAYWETHRLDTVGLRFFTVYGPFGRPDMAVWTFAEAIMSGSEVPLYDGGRMRRDFTYVDDVVEAVRAVALHPDLPGARVYNVGPGDPRDLDTLLRLMEDAFGRPARRKVLPAPAGDVSATWADPSALERDVGVRPRTPLADGVAAFARWYLDNPGLVETVRQERAASGKASPR